MKIIVVPTIHISRQSAAKVRHTIQAEKPDYIALELCRTRFYSLIHNKKPTPRQLLTSPTHAFLYLLQNLLGRLVNTQPGEEMRFAIATAAENQVPLLLVDQPIDITMQKLGQIPFPKKAELLIRSLLPIRINGAKPKALEDFGDPRFLRPYLHTLKERLPELYEILLTDRNHFMFDTVLRHPKEKVVLVCGAGHAPGMERLIKRYNLNHSPPIEYEIK